MEENGDRDIFAILPDMPAGPLDVYRQKASFDWKAMKVAVEGEELIRFMVRQLIFLFVNTFYSPSNVLSV